VASIIECRNVWKIFGVGAEKFLHQHGFSPSTQTIAEADLICAVRNVSFNIGPEKVLLSWVFPAQENQLLSAV